MIEAITSSYSSNLSEAEQLSDAKIELLADYQIHTYIQTEDEAQGRTITAALSETWIPLHDIAGNQFAAIVPLVADSSEEVGYIVVGALADGYPNYLLAWDTKLLECYRRELENDADVMAVFVPPLDFGIIKRNGPSVSYFAVDGGSYTLSDITDSVFENTDKFSEYYQCIRSESNASVTSEHIERMSLAYQQKDPSAFLSKEKESYSTNGRGPSKISTPVEDVRLKNEADFVPVYSSSKTFYGGDQGWWEDKAVMGENIEPQKASTGCGPVAAANIMYYMAKSDSKYSKLYPYSTISRTNFMKFMNTMYNVVAPSLAGEFSLDSWTSDLQGWAKSYWGVTITPYKKQVLISTTKDSCASFIKAGLKDNRPVGSLNLHLTYKDEATGDKYGWHWVTITKYYQGVSDNRWIAVSSWGERKSISWDPYWQAIHNPPGGGFAYFK